MTDHTAKNEGKQTFIFGSADARLQYGLNLADGARVVLHIEGESITWKTSSGDWSQSGETALEDGEIRAVDIPLCRGGTYSLTLERRADALRVTRKKGDGTAVTDEITGVFGVGNAIVFHKGKQQPMSWSRMFDRFQIANGLFLIGSKRGGMKNRVLTPRRAFSPLAFSRTPRTSRHVARTASASSNSPNDSGGDSDGSDGPDLPAPLPLIGGNLRNEFHSELSHKQENNINIDLLDRLTLASAGLLAAVLASLIVEWSR